MRQENSFQVRVEDLHFEAAHFATFRGTCEPLHGHSYGVAAEIEGSLSSDSWVVDFVEVKALLKGICDQLDHRMLLQIQSTILKISEQHGLWQVTTPEGKVYDLPAEDVASLPLDNTTAERLAEFISERLLEDLRRKGVENVSSVRIEVWEGPGQRAAHLRRHLPLG